MFEVRPPSTRSILNPIIRALFAKVPTQGNSGVWIETSTSEWCGILVAADNLVGYALEADDTLAEAEKSFGLGLAVL